MQQRSSLLALTAEINGVIALDSDEMSYIVAPTSANLEFGS